MSTRLCFSQTIPGIKEEEIRWFIDYIERRHRGLNHDGETENREDDRFPDFGFRIMQKENGKPYAWFYSTTYGNVAQIAELVQDFLKEYRPNSCFSLTWAEYDLEPTPGEFDGGALFVTVDEVKMFHAVEWALEREKLFTARTRANAA